MGWYEETLWQFKGEPSRLFWAQLYTSGFASVQRWTQFFLKLFKTNQLVSVYVNLQLYNSKAIFFTILSYLLLNMSITCTILWSEKHRNKCDYHRSNSLRIPGGTIPSSRVSLCGLSYSFQVRYSCCWFCCCWVFMCLVERLLFELFLLLGEITGRAIPAVFLRLILFFYS